MGAHSTRDVERGARSIEAELLLSAARRYPDPAAVCRAHAAMSRPGDIDWTTFIPLAHRHGVLPLLYHHLSRNAFDAQLVPDAALTRLRREAERATRRSLMLAGELVSIVRDLENDGIRAVSLKGPILAQQLYGSVALRRINDLDLLVAEHDVARATTLIVRRGHQLDPSWGSAALDARHRERNHDIELCSTTKPYRVELHYSIDQPLGRQRHTLAAVEDALEQITFFGTSVSVLQPETLLVYLCVHGAQHAWERIEWIGGIAELLRGGRVSDWDRVGDSARRLTAERALRSGLHLARELFDAPLPPTKVRRDWSARSAAHSVARRLTRDPSRIPGAGERLIHHVRIDSGMRNRITRLWWVFFVPSSAEMVATPLPRALSPLYYLLRPARLLLRHLRQWAPPR